MPFQRFSDITASPVTWLAPFWLPQGKMVLLDGNPGMGKSLITLHLCACLTTGRPCFADGPGLEPANVVLLNAEDSHSDIVLPRLKALGADLNRTYYFHLHDEEGLPRLPSQIHLLDGILERTRAKLLVIDPIVAFLDRSIQTNNDMSIRQALQALSRLSQERACTCLMNRHLNKTRGSEALYRGGGSIGFQGACRLSWLAAPDPLDPGRCVLAQVKNNYAPLQPSRVYRVENHTGAPMPVLRWLGPAPWAADQLAGYQRVFSRADVAKEFLQSFLEAGPRTSREVWKAAASHQLAEQTIKRAKKQLGITSQRRGGLGNIISYWCLDGQQAPIDKNAKTYPDVEEWLRPFREQFPPPNPLDQAG